MYYELATMTLPFGTAAQAATNVQALPPPHKRKASCWAAGSPTSGN